MIELSKIDVIYNQGKANEVHALKEANLFVPKGDFIAIIGPSGSGKSTLLYVIGGLLRPQGGECVVGGQALSRMSNRQIAMFRNRRIGFVLQDFGLIQNESVLSNVITPMLFAKGRILNMEKRAQKALDMVDIGELAKRKIHQLSGGQCQRVAIARAMVMDPEVLLADEPTGALDSEASERLMSVFQELNRQGKTILMVTHNTPLCAWCRRTVSIRDGELREDGAIRGIEDAPLKARAMAEA